MTQQIDDPMTAIGKLDGYNYYIYVQYEGLWFHERTVGTKARAEERVDVLRKRGKTACYTKGQIISAPLNVNEDGML
jgi:hypothetical protein